MTDIKKLHKQMMDMSLGDILLLAGDAVNMGMDKRRLDIILKYVEMKLDLRRRLSFSEPESEGKI